MHSTLPIIDAEFEDIPNSLLPNYVKPTKKSKQSRATSAKSVKASLVDSQLQVTKSKKAPKTKGENPRGRLDLLAKGIVQEQTGNAQLANLVGDMIGLTVGKKIKGPEFQFLAKLMNGSF